MTFPAKESFRVFPCASIIKLHLQIRVLNATAAKIPWTTSPKWSFNWQFGPLEDMFVVRASFVASTSELRKETDPGDADDWFISLPWASLHTKEAIESCSRLIC